MKFITIRTDSERPTLSDVHAVGECHTGITGSGRWRLGLVGHMLSHTVCDIAANIDDRRGTQSLMPQATRGLRNGCHDY